MTPTAPGQGTGGKTPVILMVAPNGARRSKADHPGLPVTIGETAREAAQAAAAGAAILHAHVRDAHGVHVLDAGLYAELIAEVGRQAQGMLVQITTEAVGRYTPEEQAAVVRAVEPAMVSVALREMVPDAEALPQAARFYAWAAEAGVHVQHILYDPGDAARLDALIADGTVPAALDCRLLVLGRYSEKGAAPEDLDAFAIPEVHPAAHPAAPWFLCAFGAREGDAIAHALARGGHARVGFENNFLARDGSMAASNAVLVAEAAEAARALGRPVAAPGEAARLLGCLGLAAPR